MQPHWPGFDALPMQKLSPNEAAEFAARVAELTKAGLPLGAGLRALAEELPGWRLPRVLRSVADRLDAGDDLIAALESQGHRLPGHLRGLILAGLRSGHLADVLEEYVDLQRSQAELRRRVWTAFAYPFVLLFILTVLAALTRLYVVDWFAKIFEDFNTTLPPITVFVIKETWPVVWSLAGLLALSIALPVLLRLAPAMGWVWPALYRVPMVGPLLRWGHMAQFSRLMGLLLEQQTPLPDALRITAAGSSNSTLARVCRSAADDTERGRPLDESMAARCQFPATLIPIVRWGQQMAALPDAFRAAAEMFEGRARSQRSLLEVMILPIMLLAIIFLVGFFVLAMFLPLLNLITTLSG